MQVYLKIILDQKKSFLVHELIGLINFFLLNGLTDDYTILYQIQNII